MTLNRTLIVFVLAILFAACGTETTTESEKDPARINVKPSAEPTVLSTEKTKAEESYPIPVYDYAGLEHIFNQKNDTTYVINFWATWCKPCVAELPYFEELNEVYENQKVKVILVSLDFKRQIKKQLIPFLERNSLASEVMVLVDPDSNTWINKVSPDWSGAIPATVVYNAEKRLFFEQSFEDFEELNDIVKPLIKS